MIIHGFLYSFVFVLLLLFLTCLRRVYRELAGGPSDRLAHSLRALSSWPHQLPKALSPNTHAWRYRFQHMNFRRQKHSDHFSEFLGFTPKQVLTQHFRALPTSDVRPQSPHPVFERTEALSLLKDIGFCALWKQKSQWNKRILRIARGLHLFRNRGRESYQDNKILHLEFQRTWESL